MWCVSYHRILAIHSTNLLAFNLARRQNRTDNGWQRRSGSAKADGWFSWATFTSPPLPPQKDVKSLPREETPGNHYGLLLWSWWAHWGSLGPQRKLMSGNTGPLVWPNSVWLESETLLKVGQTSEKGSELKKRERGRKRGTWMIWNQTWELGREG